MTYAAEELSEFDGQPVHCYRFSFGVNVYRQTSADRTITLVDGDYVPTPISSTAPGDSIESASAPINITVEPTHEIARLFLPGRPSRPVAVSIISKHRTETQVRQWFSGNVTGIEHASTMVDLVCAPTAWLLKRRIPAGVYSGRCWLQLYGPQCRLDKEDFRQDIIVGSVTGSVLAAGGFASQPDGWWTAGFIQRSDGEVRFITAHTGASITLEYPIAIAPGETIAVYAGCDRSEDTCEYKFDNLVNHQGYPRIPLRAFSDGSIT